MCLIDFDSGLLSKGPEERADGDRDHHLRGRDRGGIPHHREPRGGDTMGRGGLAALHHISVACCSMPAIINSNAEDAPALIKWDPILAAVAKLR